MTALPSKHSGDATWQKRKKATKELHLEKRDLETEMWTAGYKYSWRKMKAAHRTELKMEKSGLWPMLHWEQQGLSQESKRVITGIKFLYINLLHWKQT